MSEKPLDCTEDIDTAQSHDSCVDAVCVNAERIYDSCGAKDCLSDLQLLLSEKSQEIVDKATSVKICGANVITAMVDVDPVTFHRGFFAVNMTFIFDVSVDVTTVCNPLPTTVTGLAVYGKRVVLFGSESSTKIYKSGQLNPIDSPDNSPCAYHSTLPKASVQISNPMALSAKLVDANKNPRISASVIPESVRKRYGCCFPDDPVQNIQVTLGIFTITHLYREVQIMVPSYDYCIPRKECAPKTDDPCEVFSKIEFPTSSFFPPNVDEERPDSPYYDCKCSH